MKKRALLIGLAMVLVAALSVGLTMAYLQAESEVATNTFTVGNVGITLDEAKVDEYGNIVDENSDNKADERIIGNRTDKEYTNKYKLIPGHTYVKDPMVTVKANSESSYVRMIVKVTDYNDLVDALTGKKDANGNNYVVTQTDANNNTKEIVLLERLVSGWDSATWVSTGDVTMTTDGSGNTSATYEFRYNVVVNASTSDQPLDPLFDTFTLPGEVTPAELKTLDNLSIVVTAHAIQADGFTDATAAWAAWTTTTN